MTPEITRSKQPRDENLPPPAAPPKKRITFPATNGALSSSSSSLAGRASPTPEAIGGREVSLLLSMTSASSSASLQTRFNSGLEAYGKGDLDRAISLWEGAIDLPFGDDTLLRAQLLFHLCQALTMKNQQAHLETIVIDLEEARGLQFDDRALHTQILSLLYSALKLRNTPADRDTLIFISKEAESLCPNDPILKGKVLMMRADLFTEKAKQDNQPADLQLAIDYGTRALAQQFSSAADSITVIHNLSEMLYHRKNPGDLDRAIALLQGLRASAHHDPHLLFKTHILLSRFLLSRNGPGDRDTAMRYVSESRQLNLHPTDRAVFFDHVAGDLWDRNETVPFNDRESALQLWQEAAALSNVDPTILVNICRRAANAFIERNLIIDAIQLLHLAETLPCSDKPLRMQILQSLFDLLQRLNNFSNIPRLNELMGKMANLDPTPQRLMEQSLFFFERRQGDDVDLAILHARQGLSLLLPNDPQRPICLLLLRRMLQFRNQGTDVAEADQLLLEAQSLNSQDPFTKALVCLGSLALDGMSLVADRDTLISQFREARTLIFHEDASVHVMIQVKLARMLRDRKGPGDLDEALATLEEAQQIPLDNFLSNPLWRLIIVSPFLRTVDTIRYGILIEMAHVLHERNQPGDLNRAIACRLLVRDLQDVEASKKAASLAILSDFLIERHQPGDQDLAIQMREELLGLNFNDPSFKARSALWLAKLFAARNNPGDDDKIIAALTTHYSTASPVDVQMQTITTLIGLFAKKHDFPSLKLWYEKSLQLNFNDTARAEFVVRFSKVAIEKTYYTEASRVLAEALRRPCDPLHRARMLSLSGRACLSDIGRSRAFLEQALTIISQHHLDDGHLNAYVRYYLTQTMSNADTNISHLETAIRFQFDNNLLKYLIHLALAENYNNRGRPYDFDSAITQAQTALSLALTNLERSQVYSALAKIYSKKPN